MGFKKAHQIVAKHGSGDNDDALKSILNELWIKFTGKVPDDYENGFRRALLTYWH